VPPEGVQAAPWTLGRLDRCCVQNCSSMTPSEFNKWRKQWAKYMVGRCHRDDVIDTINMFPESIGSELRMWMNHEQREALSKKEQKSLVRILHSVISVACATHIIPTALYDAIEPILKQESVKDHMKNKNIIWCYGMGQDVQTCVNEQLLATQQVREHFLNMINIACKRTLSCMILCFYCRT
jgi:hypothetical protein